MPEMKHTEYKLPYVRAFCVLIQENIPNPMDDGLTVVQPRGDKNLTNCFKY